MVLSVLAADSQVKTLLCCCGATTARSQAPTCTHPPPFTHRSSTPLAWPRCCMPAAPPMPRPRYGWTGGLGSSCLAAQRLRLPTGSCALPRERRHPHPSRPPPPSHPPPQTFARVHCLHLAAMCTQPDRCLHWRSMLAPPLLPKLLTLLGRALHDPDSAVRSAAAEGFGVVAAQLAAANPAGCELTGGWWEREWRVCCGDRTRRPRVGWGVAARKWAGGAAARVATR